MVANITLAGQSAGPPQFVFPGKPDDRSPQAETQALPEHRGASPEDSIEISLAAEIALLESQGFAVGAIAGKLGLTVSIIESYIS